MTGTRGGISALCAVDEAIKRGSLRGYNASRVNATTSAERQPKKAKHSMKNQPFALQNGSPTSRVCGVPRD
jgi:hypothetical protein